MTKYPRRGPECSRDRVDEAEPEQQQQPQTVKREKLSHNSVDMAAENEPTQQDTVQRRVIRSKYLEVLNKISDQRDDLSRLDSQKFNAIFNEVENLHQLVQKPREQVADAEAFLVVANTLVTSVQSQSNEGVTPADFVNGLITEFGKSNRRLASHGNEQASIDWKEIGLAVLPALSICYGCCTMVGPMNTEVKQRKVAVRKKRERQTGAAARPEEVDEAEAEEKTDTDKNMSTMFEILRRKKHVRLESLILNRKSFAQTVENLFALSFLVKDVRLQIEVNEKGHHLVAPRNAPASDAVMSGKVAYNHFVFRFDFKDWKLMMDVVPPSEELMPHREASNNLETSSQAEPAASQTTLRTTPIRKLSRNRGMVIQEESVVEDSPEIDDAKRPSGLLRSKRKLV